MAPLRDKKPSTTCQKMVHQGAQFALISVTQCMDLNCGSKYHFAK